MKSPLIAILLFVSMPCFCQLSEVITDSVDSKKIIFSKTLMWISSTWKNTSKVVDLNDEESGMIVVKGGLKTNPVTLGIRADGLTLTRITFRIKDGKAKIEFSDTYFKSSAGTEWYLDDGKNPKQKEKWRKPLIAEMEELIASYKVALLSKQEDF